MDLNKILNQLIMERDLIDQAIAHLERLSPVKRGRGRPRKSPADPPREQVRAAAGFAAN